MEIKTIGVVGAGLMGNGIAHVAAMSGLQVIMSDIKDEFVERGLKNISNILSRSVDKARMSVEEKDAILGRIKTTVDNKNTQGLTLLWKLQRKTNSLKFQIFRIWMKSAGPRLSLPPIPLLFPSVALRRKPNVREDHRHALHEPCPRHETSGSDSRTRYIK